MGACPGGMRQASRPAGQRVGHFTPPSRRRTGRDGRSVPVRRGLVDAEAGLAGPDDRLAAVRDLELVEDVRDVVADRLRRDAEPWPRSRCSSVRSAISSRISSSRSVSSGKARRRAGVGVEERHQLRRDRRAEDRLSDRRRPDRPEELVRVRVLRDVATAPARIAANRSRRPRTSSGSGRRPWVGPEDLAGRLDPRHLRHPDVHQHDGRSLRRRQGDRLGTGLGLPDEREVRRPTDEPRRPSR